MFLKQIKTAVVSLETREEIEGSTFPHADEELLIALRKVVRKYEKSQRDMR